jgi:hypothetical protein
VQRVEEVVAEILAEPIWKWCGGGGAMHGGALGGVMASGGGREARPARGGESERARGETGDARRLQRCEHGCGVDARQPRGTLFLCAIGHDQTEISVLGVKGVSHRAISSLIIS